MKNRGFVLLGFGGFLIALDQLVKMYIHTHYNLGDSTPVIPGFFNITYVRNYGAAFGFLGQSHPTFREYFFLIMPPAAMGLILYMLKNVDDTDWWQIFGLTSVFGGAAGNYIDRLRFRYVIDYLDFHFGSYTYPAFNVADSAIVGGVMILIYLMIREHRQLRQQAELAEGIDKLPADPK